MDTSKIKSVFGKKGNIRNISVVLTLVIIIAVLFAGSGLALTLGVVTSVSHTPGTRSATISLDIHKVGTDVINSVQAKIGRMDPIFSAATMNVATDVNFDYVDAVDGTCTPKAGDYNYITGYGYEGPYGTSDYILRYVGYGTDYNLNYTEGTIGYADYAFQDGNGYGYEDIGDLNCTFTFNNLPEGVYVAIEPTLNGLAVIDATGTPAISLADSNTIFAILNVSGAGDKKVNFIKPVLTTYPDATALMMAQLDINGTAGEDYNIAGGASFITVDINTAFANNATIGGGNDAKLKGNAFAFGPEDSNFASGIANLTLNFTESALSADEIDRIGVYQYDNGAWSNPLTNVNKDQIDSNLITAGVLGFSDYAVGVRNASSSSDNNNASTEGATSLTSGEASTTTETFTASIPSPSADEVRSLLQGTDLNSDEIQAYIDAAGQLTIEVTLQVQANTAADGSVSYLSTFTITFKNNSGSDLTDVKIVQVVPKNVAANASDIVSGDAFNVLVSDPTIEFSVPSLAAGETGSVSYSVAKQVTQSMFSAMAGAIGKGTIVATPLIAPAPTPSPGTGNQTIVPAQGNNDQTNTIIIILVLLVIIVLVALAYVKYTKKDDGKHPKLSHK